MVSLMTNGVEDYLFGLGDSKQLYGLPELRALGEVDFVGKTIASITIEITGACFCQRGFL